MNMGRDRPRPNTSLVEYPTSNGFLTITAHIFNYNRLAYLRRPLESGVMKMVKPTGRRVLYAAVAILLLMPIIAVHSVIRAGDDKNSCLVADAPGCMYGLPTFQYQ